MLIPSYTVTIPATDHHDSSQFEPDGKFGVHRDASGWKKENPASIRCLAMRCFSLLWIGKEKNNIL